MSGRPILRYKDARPFEHVPHADDFREACELLRVLRAWHQTAGDTEDAGRDHALYPHNQYHNGGANERPLWAAVEALLARHGFGRGAA